MLALFVALGGTTYAATAPPKLSVGAKQLKPSAVTSSKVKDRSLQIVDFSLAARAALRAGGAPGSVNSRAIATGAVTTPKLADGSITTAKIADGSIGAADLAGSSVGTANLARASVTGTKLADDAVTGINVPLRIVTAVGHVNASRSTTMTAVCPVGARAFSGGVSIDTIFPSGRNVANIQRSVPTARDGIPVGWIGKVTDTDVSLGVDFTVFAICA